MRDAVRVSAPQNLDGDFSEDDYEACVDVSWRINDVAALPLPPAFVLFLSDFHPSLPTIINQELVTNPSGGLT